ncbi:poly-gamma-glutamate hydrolase family protein [Streptomyces sp. NBC_01433]|uniref:poly-gamma-glutamate hydrolase family protein n=1 Tax=Streptomyces sp. NBC_01433 TaxID=2903864 RepID=UPI00224D38B5|nr:poly-gamma-glutamate hydrolase family protein [Streptomyces sp. NBC_01433]MCX4681047.1 poly-gamma-glutamate hydrolase family protein [Streptomyces sp. NBC_01433]
MSQSHASRRTILASFVAVAAGGPLLTGLAATPAAAAGGDLYASNSDLYTKAIEGQDFARRFKRHEAVDNDKTTTPPPRLTSVLAIHGGGIEMGTSELCLGIAGYRPDSLAPVTAGAPVYDYWMLEGLRSSNNGELHVTASHCDDPVARSMAAGSANVLSLHGCTAAQAGAPTGQPKAVVVGGLNTRFRRLLSTKLSGAGFQVLGGDPDAINGDLPENICNRTLTGEGGGQLEITTELRQSLFGNFSGASNRAATTNADFWKFTNACRDAIAVMEAEQLARKSLFVY